MRLLLLAAAAAGALMFLTVPIVAVYLFRLRQRRRSQTLPFPAVAAAASPTPPQLVRFSHRQLRAATRRFAPALALGRGASASVFRGILPDGKSIAVKRLAAASLDREFQNELTVLADLPRCPFVVGLIGYCLEGQRGRFLVYEYMCNGSLQEMLFGDRASELGWERRFRVVLDVAEALGFLHLECEPPIVHGDVKPSNVLLGQDLRAKISDFGLSRFNSVAIDIPPGDLFSQELGPSQELGIGFGNYDHSTPNLNGSVKNQYSQCSTSPKGKEVAEEDLYSVGNNMKDLSGNSPRVIGESKRGSKRQWGKDWWWKQEDSGELCSKDYVTEWIGSQIIPSSNPDWGDGTKSPIEISSQLSSSSRVDNVNAKMKADNHLAGESTDASDKKGKEMREWWKEEYFAEISNKGSRNSKRMKLFRTQSGREDRSSTSSRNASQRRREFNLDISFRKGWKKKRGSTGSNDWSGDLSTTTSMRGTVCYVAPEHGGCGHLMEKSDIYSFGVLILVIVSGRRPLHVLSSPMKLERANLIGWCRQLVQTGNVLELVDERLKDSYNKEQASLCINLALRCLQRSPELRPDSGEIVKILKGEMDLPVVPFEFSPSPVKRPSSKSRRKTTSDVQ